MSLDELNDQELGRLHVRVREAVDRGDPLSDEIRRYGICDLSSLRQWIQKMEAMLDERGLSFRSFAGD